MTDLTPEQQTQLHDAADVLWSDVQHGTSPLVKPDTVGTRMVWDWCQIVARRQLAPVWARIKELAGAAAKTAALEKQLSGLAHDARTALAERDQARARIKAALELCDRWARDNGDVMSITAVRATLDPAPAGLVERAQQVVADELAARRPASSLTTDPNDPRLTHGADTEPTTQAEVYLVLSEEERAKGFVRPLRHAYRHVGASGPGYELRDLTDEEHGRYDEFGYVKYEAYPEGTPERENAIGRYWTQAQLDNVGKGCGAETRMGTALSETYARQPSFYGSTYCVRCQKHRPVNEFVWTGDGQRVGS